MADSTDEPSGVVEPTTPAPELYGLIDKVQLRFGPHTSASALQFAPGPVTVFVGPNGSGKSLALRELDQYLGGDGRTQSGWVIDSLSLRKMSPADAHLVLEAHPDYRPPLPTETTHHLKRLVPQQGHAPGSAVNISTKNPALDRHMAYAFSITLDGATRINLLDGQAREALSLPQSTVLGRLFKNDSARKELQVAVRDAFDRYLIIDFHGQQNWAARLSIDEPPAGVEKLATEDAIQFIQNTRHISSFGDGTRAYVGMLAAAYAMPWRLILLDEPEAFLHPPLITRLGRTLSTLAARNQGHLVATTHSSEFVMGCVLSGIQVNIVRLTYRNDKGSARLLNGGTVKSMMRNPIVRSTDLLAGLFHNASVVVESDADRAFYQEINLRLMDAGLKAAPDARFVSGYGKGTLPQMLGPLRQTGIPTAAIVDLDILFENAGAWKNWMDAACVPALERQSLSSQRDSLAEVFKSRDIKPSKRPPMTLDGTTQSAVRSLYDALARFGIFIVTVGCLEKWRSDVTGRKSDWLAKAFDSMKSDRQEAGYEIPPAEASTELQPNELPTIWQFLLHVAAWLNDERRLGMPT